MLLMSELEARLGWEGRAYEDSRHVGAVEGSNLLGWRKVTKMERRTELAQTVEA